jgi:hypothetical protein
MSTKESNYTWIEDLPKNCPPNDAFSPEELPLYRLIRSFPPTMEDFRPNPHCNISECINKSVSLFSRIENALELKKLPRHKDKLIARVILLNKDGLIKHTFSNPSHYSWWITRDFNPEQSEII